MHIFFFFLVGVAVFNLCGSVCGKSDKTVISTLIIRTEACEN